LAIEEAQVEVVVGIFYDTDNEDELQHRNTGGRILSNRDISSL
jgi:hypothetical protein